MKVSGEDGITSLMIGYIILAWLTIEVVTYIAVARRLGRRWPIELLKARFSK